MLAKAVVCLVALALSSQVTSGQDLCHDDFHDPFQLAKNHLLVPNQETLTGAQMEDLAGELFQRFDCTTLGHCDCFPVAKMRELLDMEDSADFDEEHFNKASVMLIETMRDMNGYCPRIYNDSTLTYGTFEHFLTDCTGCHEPHGHAASGKEGVKAQDEHGHSHDFSWTSLDQYSHVLNHTYQPDSVNCLTSFTAESVFRGLPLHNPGNGVITEAEVPVMSASLVMHFVEGGCLHHSHWDVDEEDFMMSLFRAYANHSTCLIYEDGLDSLMHDLAVAEHAGDHEHDDHDAHGHAQSATPHNERTYGLIMDFWSWGGDSVRATEDVHNHEHEHEHDHGPSNVPINASYNCFSTEVLLAAFDIDIENGMDSDQLKEISSALMQQAAVGCQHVDDEAEPDNSDKLTTAQMYGYGTLAVLAESLCALIGLVIVKWQRTAAYKYILVTMLGLSVGTMCGDAILHLIPIALNLHSHDGDAHDHSHDGVVVEDYTLKMLVMMGAIWLFFMLQLGMEALVSGDSDEEDNVVELQKANPVDGIESYSFKGELAGIENQAYNGSVVDINLQNGVKPNGVAPYGETPNGNTPNGTAPQKKKKGGHGHSHLPDDAMGDDNGTIKTSPAVPWMILVGDGLHNFADGMAIGAAFVAGWRAGLSTTIAVFCHELPHEFGDIAAVLAAGWSPMRALAVNLGAALCAFVGLYIAIPVANALDADTWILALAAGMFIYISLADIIPQLVEFFRVYNKTYMFIAANCGFGFGFLIMLLIAIFEDQIAV